MDEIIRKNWDSGTPLRVYFGEFFPKTDSSNQGFGGDEAVAANTPTDSTSFAERMVHYLQAQSAYDSARSQAITSMRKRLVAGYATAIGVRANGKGKHALVEIEPSAWIAAEISPEQDIAYFNDRELRDIVIVETQRDDQSSNQLPVQANSELPADGLRSEAVAQCEKAGLVDLYGGPKSKRNGTNNIKFRTQIYLDWIRRTYPNENTERRGFSPKSFEVTEKAHKNKG
ncbi:hypothetical protein [Hyphomonas sp.]|uniref:hypothetical protein n=1 Tax=Hyphomonas sp. TaxID=87 RepID=UPI003F70A24B